MGDGETAAGEPGLAAASGHVIEYRDLGAEVAVDHIPAQWSARLPALYSSSFSTLELFPVVSRAPRFSACRLTDPEHIVVFAVEERAVRLLNRIFSVGPADVDRVAEAVFRTHRQIDRVLVQLPFEPGALAFPATLQHRLSDVVVALPDDIDSSLELLGRSTRINVRNARNRLKREYPDHEFVVVDGEEIDAGLLDLTLDLVRERMRSTGRVALIEDDRTERMLPFARRWGLVCALRIDGHIAAADLCSRVGNQMFDHHGSFRPELAYYRIGLLTRLHAIDVAISSGCSAFHLLWGETSYKFRLSGVPRPLYDVAVFRSRRARLAAVDDWSRRGAERARSAWRAGARRGRTAARKGVDAALRRSSSTSAR